jgi:predicted transposase YbfD/YdcC
MEIDPRDLMDCLAELEDPRIDRTKKHALIDIIFIAITAALCGAKTWVDIADFGEAKTESFSKFLDLENGIPSHDTFRRVFILLSPDNFFSIFKKWIKIVTDDADLEQICIDGKSLRSTFEKGRKCSALHMVNAWSTGVGLALGQVQTDKKSNEITAIPELLDKLDIEGTIVSMDAMGCQVKIAEKIRKKVADYLLALKGNQGSLEGKVKGKFLEISRPGPKTFTVDKFTTVDENSHGRHETRRCRVIQAKNNKNLGVNILLKWPDLNSLIEIKSERVDRKTGLIGEETHYYISSALESAEFFLKSVRNHWQVENNLHWVLDVVFKEDECPITAGYSAQNFSMLRQFALNLIKLEPSKKSIRRKQNLGGWDDSFLMRLIAGGRYLDA